ncbi:MAG: hypothetical protein ACRD3Q_20740 [Terriglobales bacterium]
MPAAIDSANTPWYQRPAFAVLATGVTISLVMLLIGYAQRDEAGNRPVPIPWQTASNAATTGTASTLYTSGYTTTY